MELFGSDDENEVVDENWWQNNKNREEYNQRKNAEALQRAKERGIDVDEDDEESSEEDSDGEQLTQKVEVDILKTLHAIRTKDPKIYDSKHNFFNSDGDSTHTAVTCFFGVSAAQSTCLLGPLVPNRWR